jgi:hypothetical protein
LVFVGAMMSAASRYAWSVAGPRIIATSSYTWDHPLHKVEAISGVLFAGYEPYIRNLVFLLVLVPVALLLAERIRLRPRGPRPWGERAHAARFEILALLLFVGYLAAPASVRATTLVYHRLLPPAWAVFAVGCATGTAATARPLPRLLCALAPVASLLVGWPTFVDANRMYSDLDTLMPLIEKDSTVMSLDLGPQPPVRLWGPMVAMGHVVALKGGRALYDYTQSPLSPVAQRPKKQWSESITRLESHAFDLTTSWDMLRYRYLLISTPSPLRAVATTLAVRNDATLIGQAGDWYLYESRILRVPINARDAWPPTPHPPTLQVQFAVVSRELSAIESAGATAGM